MIMPGHVTLWRRILDQAFQRSGDCLIMGVQDIPAETRQQPGFSFSTFTELLQSLGHRVQTMDLFDARADIRHDLNLPVPPSLHGQFDILLDIGTIEHVFDTRQVLMNYLSLVRPGGQICLHVPVSGYYRHGLHTFSPELFRRALIENGCELSFEAFSDHRGNAANEDELRGIDALMWVVAKRIELVAGFRVPQQAGWSNYYAQPT